MNAPTPTIEVVIVNYRTGPLVVECLRSLEPEVRARPGTTVVVVDNASNDGSVEVVAGAIASAGWSWATVVSSAVNAGFAAGNNVAIRLAMSRPHPPDVFWLLNPDTTAEPGALRELAAFMAQRPDVGICGGRILESDRSPWSVALRFPGILSEFERAISFGPVSRLLARWAVLRPLGEAPEAVDWVSGATMAIRREVVERLGLLDEGYFLYFEETDYCLRAKRAGVSCWQVPSSRIVHIAGQSTKVTAKDAPARRIPAYWFAARRRYFAKNHGRVYAAVADLAWLVGHAIGRLTNLLRRKRVASPPHLVADFLRHSSLWRSHHEAAAKTTAQPTVFESV